MTQTFPRSKTEVWLQELRLPFLVVTLLPVFFGAVVAWASHIHLNMPVFVIAAVGAVFVHLGANVINDYFDYHNGTDAANVEYVRGFTGGSRAIQDGGLTQGEVLAGAVACFAAAAFVTAYLGARFGLPILFMGMAGLAAAVTYSMFMHSLLIGELMVGLCFGMLLPAGSFYLQAGFISREVLYASIPMGLLVFLILLINEIPDYTADKASNKKTLAVRLGRKGAAFLYVAVLGFVYIYITGIAVVLRTPVPLTSLFTLPLAVRSCLHLLKYYDVPIRLRSSIIATILLFTLNSAVLLTAYIIRGI
jgi:1,4-dihydroxy-2-naphthoate octaprenyltransferase